MHSFKVLATSCPHTNRLFRETQRCLADEEIALYENQLGLQHFFSGLYYSKCVFHCFVPMTQLKIYFEENLKEPILSTVSRLQLDAAL